MLLDIQLLEHHALIAPKGEGFEGEPAGCANSDLFILSIL